VNRIFGEQKAVLFGSIHLPIFQIRRMLWFYFVWWKKLVYQPIYLRSNKNSRSIAFFCGSLVNRIFGGQKAVLFGSIHLPIFQILRTLWFYFVWWKKNCYIRLFIYAQIKNLTLNCILCGSLVNRIFVEQRAVLFGSIRLPIFQILRTLWFYFVWWKKNLYKPIYLRPNKNSRSIAFFVVR
jgi:hypothetical protein